MLNNLDAGQASSIVAGAELEAQFERLAARWREESQFMSSVTDMVMLPSYQRIIGMGREAVPLLLRELERDPDNWFWALQAITGEDPVPASDRGALPKMAAS